MSTNDNICPACGVEIPAVAPAGMCPKCLLNNAAPAADTSVDDDATVFMESSAAPLSPEAKAMQEATRSRESNVPSPHDPKKGAQQFAPPVDELAQLFPDLEILELLGAGGMGAVYKARQPRLDRLVALKILSCPREYHDNFALRFEREAQLLAKLNHPNIVTIFDFGELERSGDNDEENNLFYFMMEYVDGADLNRLIHDGGLEPQQALALVPQICDALQFAHDEGITHRDIKPANILVDQKGNVHIADFGLAKLIGADQEEAMMTGLTMTGTSMGTPHYMAPEQWDAPEKVDHRVDIYSLGVVFYEMLTGQRPHGVFEPPSEKTQVDHRIDSVVLKAMEKEPEERYQQASEVKEDVTRVVTKPVEVVPASKSRVGLWVGIALASVAIIGLVIWQQVNSSKNPGGVTDSSTDYPVKSPNLGAKEETGVSDSNRAENSQEMTSNPGSLRSWGVDSDGHPLDLAAAEGINDFVEVRAIRSNEWFALRSDGSAVYSNGDTLPALSHRRIFGSGQMEPAYTDENRNLNSEKVFYSIPELESDIRDALLYPAHGLLLLENGRVVVLGNCAGNGPIPWSPPPQAALSDVDSIHLGRKHAAVVSRQGEIFAWSADGPIPLPDQLKSDIKSISLTSYAEEASIQAITNEGRSIFWREGATIEMPDWQSESFVGVKNLFQARALQTDSGIWKMIQTQRGYYPELANQLSKFTQLPASQLSGQAYGTASGYRSNVIWIEPQTTSTSLAQSDSSPNSDNFEAIQARGGFLRAWSNPESDQEIDLRYASDLDDFYRIDVLSNNGWWAGWSRSAGLRTKSSSDHVKGKKWLSFQTHGYVDSSGTLNSLDESGGYYNETVAQLSASLEPGTVREFHQNGPQKIVVMKSGKVHCLPWDQSRDKVRQEKWLEVSSGLEQLNSTKSVSLSKDTGIAVQEDGTVSTWTLNLGMVTPPSDLPPIQKVSCAEDLFVALSVKGEVFVWSSKPAKHNQLVREVPPFDLPVINIRAGKRLAAAQLNDGTWKAWGENVSGMVERINQLGPAIDLQIVAASSETSKNQLYWIEPAGSAPPSASLPQATPGRLQAYGTLGEDGPIDLSAAEGIIDFVQVLLRKKGRIGIRENGELISSIGPTTTSNAERILPMGAAHAVILKKDCSIDYFFGSDNEGFRSLARQTPASIGQIGARNVAGGEYHGIAHLQDGTAVVWGDFYSNPGQLPEWLQYEKSWPLPPKAALKDVRCIGGGNTWAGTITNDGRLWIWGYEGLIDLGQQESLQGQFLQIHSTSAEIVEVTTQNGQVFILNLTSSGHGSKTAPLSYQNTSASAYSGYRILWRGESGNWFTYLSTEGMNEFLQPLHGRNSEDFSVLFSFQGWEEGRQQINMGMITIEAGE